MSSSPFLTVRAFLRLSSALTFGLAILHGQQLSKNTFVLSDVLLVALGIAIVTAIRFRIKHWGASVPPLNRWILDVIDTILQYLGVVGVMVSNSWLTNVLTSHRQSYVTPLRYVPLLLAFLAAVIAFQYVYYTLPNVPVEDITASHKKA